jgi:hypothetical protein
MPLPALPVNLPSATVGHPHALTHTIFADPVRRLAVCLAMVAIQTVSQTPPNRPTIFLLITFIVSGLPRGGIKD